DGTITSSINYNYSNSASWGNPIGEMLFEAVRYMAGTLNTPSSGYLPPNEVAITTSASTQPTFLKTWGGRPALAGSDECAKPVIMLISDLDNDFDGDNFPTADFGKDPLRGGEALPAYSMKSYLDAITANEKAQADGTLKGSLFIYAKDYKDACTAKALTSLAEVNGICPNHGAFMGTYSAAAAAYYAHTHDFKKSGQKDPMGIDIYAISLASAYPQLDFVIRDAGGNISKKISVLPGSGSARSNDTKDRYLGFINYFITDWQTDKHGDPFSVTIVVNYEDAVQGVDGGGGSDWDMDVIVKYTISLVTYGSTPTTIRSTTPVPTITAGPLQVGPLNPAYYPFKNPDNMTSRDDMIEIDPDYVAGLVIASRRIRVASSIYMSLGYSVSGSTTDGAFRPLTNQGGGNPSYTQSFVFNSNPASAGEPLPNPMWLAAKYGGFTDRNQNGKPDPGEWAGPDGNPKTYFQPANIAELPENLEAAFAAIAKGTSTGTATSASVNSILGGGVSIQTLFYPEYEDRLNGNLIKWTGSVFGLFVDKWGNLREDTNGDRKLTLKTGKPGDTGYPLGDFIINFEEGTGVGPTIARYYDQHGNGVVVQPHDALGSFLEIKPLWDTSRLLANMANITDRQVYYGKPDGSGGVTPARFEAAAAYDLEPFMTHVNTGTMLPIQVGENLTEELIQYVLGEDHIEWRSRRVTDPWGSGGTACDPNTPNDPNCLTWRLGDVINSKPVIVGSPAMNFDLLYSDSTYYDFKMAQAQRRSMAYFGANDGMLHAVNLGFYGSLEDGQVGYKVDGPMGQPGHELGKEMWAFVPTSVLPHLQWLADPEYLHSYYVDMKPQIADVRIGGEWKTILIGGLRLGGREIESDAPELGPMAYSEIFAIDVTDPELEKPKLLWRYSSDRLGMSVGLPTIVSKVDSSNNEAWYVVAASGPTTALTDIVTPYEGNSDQEARLIVLDIATGTELRDIPVPTAEGRSFFTDSFLPMAASPLINPSDPRTPWSHTTIYYGLTISRDPLTCLDTGAVYRLDMTGDLAQWGLKKLIDTERPVTGAINAAYDQTGNLWVVFGTGRVWGADDLRPCVSAPDRPLCNENHEQYLYGVKEDLDAGHNLTFKDQTTGKIADMSGAKVFTCFATSAGYVTDLMTTPNQNFTPTNVCGLSTQGVPYTTISNALLSNTYVGYKRRLDTVGVLGAGGVPRYEMIVTQPKIDGLSNGRSMMGFTSFEPPQGTCGDPGTSYLHMVDTFTGLPAPHMYDVFAPFFTDNASVTTGGQVTGYRPAGGGKATEAVIIKIGNKTIIRASAQDGSIKDLEITDAAAPASSIISWREATEIGFTMPPNVMSGDLPTPTP
ncbi:MAG: hypothetical protein LBV79_11845, partial [Candidatus Adiutrix sp.]|nr:hypothetical protein [Candidatus Adiutrix sp.]